MKSSPIHVVSTFHYDVLYLKDYDEYLEQAMAIIDRALEILEAEPDYCFTIEQVILVREYFRRRPERRETMRVLAQAQRLSFAPGMFVMPDMNMIDGESLFRQAKVGREWLAEHLGVVPEACWIADCWGHHAQLPQILRQSGYSAYFFWRCMRPDVARSDFLWQGLDGTKIVTHWLSRGYAGIHFPDNGGGIENRLELQIAEASGRAIDTLADQLHTYGEFGATLICNGGDFCIPQAGAPATLRELNRNPDADLRFSTPAAYHRAVNEAALETFSGEFNAAFQGTYSTNIAIKQLLWSRREALLAEEGFRATHGLASGDLAGAWETLLTHQFHDTICGTITDAALLRARGELEALRVGASAPAALYNPASHTRREVVELADGKRVIADLKPFEAKPFHALEAAPSLEKLSELPGEFSNRFYRARFGRDGFLESLRTPAGVELVDAASPARFGAPVMLNDNGDSWLIYEGPLDGGSRAAAFTCNCADPLEREPGADGLINRKNVYPCVESVECFRSAQSLRIVQRGWIAFWRNRVEFTLQSDFDADSPLIRFRLEFLPHGRHYRLRAAFPTTLRNGTVLHEIPFGLQKRGHSEYPAQGFCDCAAAGAGLTLFNRGIPGNNVDANGVMLLSIFRSVAMEYKCESELSFNDGVPHTAEYALMPRDGESLAPVMVPAELYARPVYGTIDLPVRYDFSGIELPENVRISALRESAGGIFLRFYEALGQGAEVRFALPEGMGSWRDADGVENPQSAPRSGRVTLQLAPFEIRAILLSPVDGR